ncbi:MAG TPA: hypothetical protein VI248_07000, partial [Kineosporiaceae bacterium]
MSLLPRLRTNPGAGTIPGRRTTGLLALGTVATMAVSACGGTASTASSASSSGSRSPSTTIGAASDQVVTDYLRYVGGKAGAADPAK